MGLGEALQQPPEVQLLVFEDVMQAQQVDPRTGQGACRASRRAPQRGEPLYSDVSGTPPRVPGPDVRVASSV